MDTLVDSKVSLDLRRVTASPRQARHAVSAFLDDAGLGYGDALLVVSELVTNAVRHGAGRIRLELAIDGRELLLQVSDEGSADALDLPVQRRTVSGRGLVLVGGVSDAWGIARHEVGKTVWARVSV